MDGENLRQSAHVAFRADVPDTQVLDRLVFLIVIDGEDEPALARSDLERPFAAHLAVARSPRPVLAAPTRLAEGRYKIRIGRLQISCESRADNVAYARLPISLFSSHGGG